jgi:hypothetical protein
MVRNVAIHRARSWSRLELLVNMGLYVCVMRALTWAQRRHLAESWRAIMRRHRPLSWSGRPPPYGTIRDPNVWLDDDRW